MFAELVGELARVLVVSPPPPRETKSEALDRLKPINPTLCWAAVLLLLERL
jgi:hypothetical protein